MTCFAALVGERVISREKMQRILFGLCRMEALRVRYQVGKCGPLSVLTFCFLHLLTLGLFAGDAKTVLFTIPGQAVTPILLPLLQAAFPEDRHVFGYQSCIESVERAMSLRSGYKRATVPASLEEAVSYSGPAESADPSRLTTPMLSRFKILNIYVLNISQTPLLRRFIKNLT